MPLAFWSLSRICLIPNFLWNPFVALADHHLERLLDRHSAMRHSLKQLTENVFLTILQATSNLDLPCVNHIHSEAQHAEPFHQKTFVIFALQYQFFQCHVVRGNAMGKRANVALTTFRVSAVAITPWPTLTIAIVFFPHFSNDAVALIRHVLARLAWNDLEEYDAWRRWQLRDPDLRRQTDGLDAETTLGPWHGSCKQFNAANGTD